MPPLLFMMACAVGGAPATPGSASARAADAIAESSAHARVVLAEAGRMQELSASLETPEQREAMRDALALAKREHAALERSLAAAKEALQTQSASDLPIP